MSLKRKSEDLLKCAIPVDFEKIFTPLNLLAQYLDKKADIRFLACSRGIQRVFGHLFAKTAICRPLQAVQTFGRHGCQYVQSVVIAEAHDLEVAYAYSMNISNLYMRTDVDTLVQFCAYPPKGVTYLNVSFNDFNSWDKFFWKARFAKWKEVDSLVLGKNFNLLWMSYRWLPPNLKRLELGNNFNMRLQYNIHLFPPSLQTLILGTSFNQTEYAFSESLVSLTLRNRNLNLRTSPLPPLLQDLTIFCPFRNDFELPSTLQRLKICGKFHLDVGGDEHKFSTSLVYLDFSTHKDNKCCFSQCEGNVSVAYPSEFVNPLHIFFIYNHSRFPIIFKAFESVEITLQEHFNWILAHLAPHLCPDPKFPLCYFKKE